MKQTLKKILKEYIKIVGIKKFIFILIFGLLVSFTAIVEPLFFAELIKKLENFYKTGNFNSKELIEIIIYWSVFIIFTIIVSFYYRYNLIDKSILNIFLKLYERYGNNIINMSYGEYLKKKTGSIYKKIDRGVQAIDNTLFFLFLDFYKNISGIIFIIIILLYIDIKMTLIALSMLPIMIYAGYYFYTKLTPLQLSINKKWDNNYGLLGDFLTNFSLVKILGLEGYYDKKTKKQSVELINNQLSISKGWSISDIYVGILVMISRILILGFGVFFVIEGKITLAVLFLFFSYIGWIYFPLSAIFGRARQFQENITAIENMLDEFDNLEMDKKNNKGIKIENLKGNIKFEKVNFSYSKNKKIIKDLNFEIKPGKNIALIGNTGSGKSTIINLLLRFWDTKSGKILVDNIDIKDIKKSSLRDNIGVVSQDNPLFNMTIKQNLLFANPKATNKDLEKVLKKAEAHFVFDLEKGINTIIGERGLKLSGGEKQRLSIARLFLKDPQILILDEATSALDNKTEKLIQKSLDKLMKGRTSIIIAHRLSTIQNTDRIFMIENGNIVEQGKYEELMDKKGKFYNLANPDHLIIN